MAVLACFLWATPFVFIKKGLDQASPLLFAGIRFILSGLIILPFALSREGSIKKVISAFPSAFKISVLQTYLLYLFFYLGIARTGASTTAIIVGTSPLISAITAHFYTKNDRLNLTRTAAFLLGIAGVIMLVINSSASNGIFSFDVLGIILVFLSCISSGFGNVFVSKNRSDYHPFTLNAIQILTGGIMLTTTASLFERPCYLNMSYGMLFIILWLSFISACAFTIWFYLLKEKQIKVSELNLWKFIIPVIGAALSWIIIPEEHPSLLSVSGMILTALSVIIFFSDRKHSYPDSVK